MASSQFCSNCGIALKVSANFCSGCGSAVTEASADVSNWVPPNPASPPAAQEFALKDAPRKMDLVDATRHGLRNAFRFRGRSSRSQHWYFVLGSWLILISALFLGLVNEVMFRNVQLMNQVLGGTIGVITIFFWVASALGGVASLVRRLHDTNRSGWWILIAFLPWVGGIILLVFACSEGDRSANRFGPPLRD